MDGRLSATATSLTNPTSNGFAQWYGLVDHSLPPNPFGLPVEWIQAGWFNGIFSGNLSLPKNNDYNWYSEFNSGCNGHTISGHGGYTPGTSHKIAVYQTNSSYDCSTGGTTFVYLHWVFLNGQFANQSYLLTSGDGYRADANIEYFAWDWMNPVGTVCFGRTNPGAGCTLNSDNVRRMTGASWTWSDWLASGTTPKNDGGYLRTNITTNYRFKVTSIW